MDGDVDAETLLGAIDKFLAERGADVDIRKSLAVAHDRRDAEDAQFLPPGFDADDLLPGRQCLDDRGAARRDVVAGDVWKEINGMPCVFRAVMAPPSSAPNPSRSPLAMTSCTGGSAAITELTASAARPS